jgi:hypothetical protein
LDAVLEEDQVDPSQTEAWLDGKVVTLAAEQRVVALAEYSQKICWSVRHVSKPVLVPAALFRNRCSNGCCWSLSCSAPTLAWHPHMLAAHGDKPERKRPLRLQSLR